MPDCVKMSATFDTEVQCWKSVLSSGGHFILQGCQGGVGSPPGNLGPLGGLGSFASRAPGTRVPSKWACPVGSLPLVQRWRAQLSPHPLTPILQAW